MVKLLSLESCNVHKMDMCQVCILFKKPTTVACWNAGFFSHRVCRCAMAEVACARRPAALTLSSWAETRVRRPAAHNLLLLNPPQFARIAADAMVHLANSLKEEWMMDVALKI